MFCCRLMCNHDLPSVNGRLGLQPHMIPSVAVRLLCYEDLHSSNKSVGSGSVAHKRREQSTVVLRKVKQNVQLTIFRTEQQWLQSFSEHEASVIPVSLPLTLLR